MTHALLPDWGQLKFTGNEFSVCRHKPENATSHIILPVILRLKTPMSIFCTHFQHLDTAKTGDIGFRHAVRHRDVPVCLPLPHALPPARKQARRILPWTKRQ
ncbi:hypothetical protein [Nitrosovibrio sp. Nv17]|uniref:hypothetical protein n=1 Tax=Nitrosovibrio sp. Nv17 TaxID=1855339 RepID=UPI0015A62F2B|nr:hypothetical protein [Nitrosovibrio sp. Nv17]